MNVRIGVAITAAGLAAHAVALAYMAQFTLQGVAAPLVAVLGPILLVSIGALVGTGSGSQKGPRRRPFVAPFLIGSVVLVSALGPAKITQARARLAPGSVAGVGREAAVRAQLVLLAARDDGPAAALEVLREQIEEEPELILLSHHLAHETGRISIEQADFDLELIGECTFEFASGCFHGMLERYFFARPPVSEADLPTFCLDLTRDATLGTHALECSHGLGHGLAVRWSHEPMPAVADCDLLASSVERRECHDGVFMEIATHSLGGGHAGGSEHGNMDVATGEHAHDSERSAHEAQPTDVTYPCSVVAAPYQPSCWTYQHLLIRANSGNSWERTHAGCQAAADVRLISECVFGMGKQLATENSLDWSAVYEGCAALPEEGGQACIAGAVEHFVDLSWTTGEAFLFCGNAPRGIAEGCYFRLGTRLGFLHLGGDALAACDRVVGPLREACTKGVAQTLEAREPQV